MASPDTPDRDVAARVMDIIAKEGMIEPERVTREATLEDLQVQSVDMLMILQALEEDFGLYIPMDESVTSLQSVDDLIGLIERMLAEKAGEAAT